MATTAKKKRKAPAVAPDPKPARAAWLAPAFFGPAQDERERPKRFHWYNAGAQRSACGNYPLPFMAYTSADKHELCVRCVEAFTLAKLPVPPFNSTGEE